MCICNICVQVWLSVYVCKYICIVYGDIVFEICLVAHTYLLTSQHIITRHHVITHHQAAAKSANAHNFISEFPDGYKTQVGEKGVFVRMYACVCIAVHMYVCHNRCMCMWDYSFIKCYSPCSHIHPHRHPDEWWAEAAHCHRQSNHQRP